MIWSKPLPDILTAVDNSIMHHIRIKNFAKSQNPGKRAELYQVRESIGEGVSANDCALCQMFQTPVASYCHLCPLGVYGYNCGKMGSPWGKIVMSETWGSLVYVEEKFMLPALMSVRNEILEEMKKEHETKCQEPAVETLTDVPFPDFIPGNIIEAKEHPEKVYVVLGQHAGRYTLLPFERGRGGSLASTARLSVRPITEVDNQMKLCDF